MKALKKAEESQQGALGGSEPTLRELADELSLEPRAHEVAAVKKTELDPHPSAPGRETPREAANLFAAKEPQKEGSKRLLVALSAAALLLLLGGGAYVYIAINKPSLLIPARTGNAPIPPPVSLEAPEPQVESQMQPTSVAASPVEVMGEVLEQAHSVGAMVSNAAAMAAKKMQPRAAEPAQESSVQVLRGTQVEINPDLAQGYQALQEGRLDTAQAAYKLLLQQEPRNMDGLLGMAAVEARLNNPGEAGRLYLRALDVEPKNIFAQAGLLNLLGSADPAGSEAKLKRLLADQPSALLHFALGNLYAAEERWPDAQQAYFQAYRLASANPDYAFNLAVSLEHINQPKPALTYYQRALQLLGQGGTAAFDRAAVETRIVKLKRMSE